MNHASSQTKKTTSSEAESKTTSVSSSRVQLRESLRGMSYSQGTSALSPMVQRHGDGDGHDHDHASEEDVSTRMDQEEGLPEGGDEHVLPKDADTDVRTQLAKYVKGAVKEGRKIAGLAKIVDDAAWDVAGKAHYGSRWDPPGGRRNKINGFVDRNGRVWVHQDRGNSGTMIHEAVHKYSSSAMIKESQPLNEGVTEYFARKVLAQTQPTLKRRNYQRNYRTVSKLVNWVSEPTVAAGYFDGAITTLRNKFNVMARAKTVVNDGESTGSMIGGVLGTVADVVGGAVGVSTSWTTFCKHCSDQNWAKANAMLAL